MKLSMSMMYTKHDLSQVYTVADGSVSSRYRMQKSRSFSVEDIE